MANETGAERFCREYMSAAYKKLGIPEKDAPDVILYGGPVMRETMEAYKDSCTAALEARIGQLESMYRAKDIIAANLAGKLEKAETEVRELKAQLAQIRQDAAGQAFEGDLNL